MENGGAAHEGGSDAVPSVQTPDKRLDAALSEKSLHEGALLELQVFGMIVGGVVGAVLLLLILRYLLRNSYIALRIGSTFITIGGVIATYWILFSGVSQSSMRSPGPGCRVGVCFSFHDKKHLKHHSFSNNTL